MGINKKYITICLSLVIVIGVVFSGYKLFGPSEQEKLRRLSAKYNLGIDGFEKDNKKALEFLIKAHEIGPRSFASSIAQMHENGDGTKKDYKKAMEWYSVALRDKSDKYWKGAPYYIGSMYEFGRGVKRDLYKAQELYLKANENGWVYAPDGLARIKKKIKMQTARGTVAKSKRSSSKKNLVKTELTWDYNYSSIDIPPSYRTELKEEGIFFKDYYWETTQDTPGYTVTDLQDIYFSIRIQNKANHPVRVKFEVTALEKFSVIKTAGKVIKTGIWGAVGAAAAAYVTDGDEDAIKAGAALGATASYASQVNNNELFTKQKSFTENLGPNEIKYVTGKFPLSKHLEEYPKIKILSVR